MTTVMLVHGAWHRSKTWEKLEAELHALGYGTHAPALPSAGERPTAGMHDDAAVVAQELASIEGPVVLLGHSYGGMPITEAAAGARNVERLIYLAAYMPDEGQSLFDIEGRPTPDDVSGVLPLSSGARTSFYSDLPDAEAEQAMSTLVDQTVRSFAEKVGAVAWRDIPSTYVVPEDDQAISPALQQKMAAQAAEIRRLPSGHSPFLSQPRVLAALIDEIACQRPAVPHRALPGACTSG
ncbi:alpha/beta hydrolase [Actinopolymorpha pittospori]|uniref:Pimeloyl-ACP methyl ester carboxylesterase n=1 Tax=Actinopolymorpha pittospori TaxID=648752 RepID=A0A927MUA8_9ACTN|nr:alpha/beta hydrolase [Actinopolymorpha pittospori]MBE1606442.1 pimeloyl-ACP methyl ester carboxylesterase [Actinopolymorpha pittospori]